MKLTAPLLAIALVASNTEAFEVPKPARTTPLATQLAKGCATAAACAALVLGPTATHAAVDDTLMKVNVNTPYLLESVKTSEARDQTIQKVQFLADSIRNIVGPAVNVELPSPTDANAVKGIVKKAVTGGATVSVNGQDVGVQVVGSQAGYLTVQVSNKLIPAIPFVGLDGTPWIVNKAAETAVEAAPAAVNAALTIKEKVVVMANTDNLPFYERPVMDGNLRLDIDIGNDGKFAIHKALTPVDIVGGGSLGLGLVYAGSYSWYNFANYQEEQAAAKKKEERMAAMAAKKKAAAAAAVKVPAVKVPAVKAAPAATVTTELQLPEEEMVAAAPAVTAPDVETSAAPVVETNPKEDTTTTKSRISQLFRR